jgi:opacity protein-like surface antigen
MRKFSLLIAMAALLLTCSAFADSIVFDLSPSNGTTFRSADSGPGQGVSVSTTQTISGFGFFLDMPFGGDLKFMIWNDNNTSLLLTDVRSFSAFGTQQWVYTDPINFTLNAGHTYWFGVIADNEEDVGYIFPPVNYSANGLTALTSGNSNYSNFANPSFVGTASAQIALRITEGSAVPEPGSIALMGTGVIGLAGLLRRKMNL